MGCRSFGRLGIVYNNNISVSRREMDIFECRFKKEIDGKFFLFIFDDVCMKYWLRLKNLFVGGVRGSYVLVIIRFVKVVDLVKIEIVEVY